MLMITFLEPFELVVDPSKPEMLQYWELESVRHEPYLPGTITAKEKHQDLIAEMDEILSRFETASDQSK